MRTRIILGALIAVLALGGLFVGLAAAQTEEADERSDIVERFAEELGVSVEELDAAFRTVLSEQLDEAVADGRLTRERADQILERLDERGIEGILGLGHRRGGHFGGPGPFSGPGRFGGLGGQEVTGDDAERASEAALAEVGGGDVLRVFEPRRGDAAYAVLVRTDEGTKALVLLDQDFEVTDVHQWDRRGPSEQEPDPSTSEAA